VGATGDPPTGGSELERTDQHLVCPDCIRRYVDLGGNSGLGELDEPAAARGRRA
jgi:hypothetical protein